MKSGVVVCGLGLVALMVIGCTHSPVQVYNPKSGGEGRADIHMGMAKREGESCQHWILYILPISDSRIDEALTEMSPGGIGDLGLVTVERKNVFWLVGYTKCVVVTGYPAKDPAYYAKKKQAQLGKRLEALEALEAAKAAEVAPEPAPEPGAPELPVDEPPAEELGD